MQDHNQPTTTIPHPKVTFFNLNSASANYSTLNSPEHIRHKQVLTTIKFLLERTEILCLSETHFRKNDKTPLDRYFPNHTLYYNNGTKGRAGLLTIIPNSFKKKIVIKTTYLGPSTEGRLQYLTVTPQDNFKSHCKPYNLLSCYFPGDNRILPILATFPKIDPTIHTILGGDLNSVEIADDAPQDNSLLLLSGLRKTAWTKAFDHLSLTEIPQPLHTHYYITTKLSDCRTSRIDRIYTSHNLAEKLLTSPTASCPLMPDSILGIYNDITDSSGKRKTKSKRYRSDHIPVTLSFFPKKHLFTNNIPQQDRPFRVPSWAPTNKVITNYIDFHINNNDHSQDCYGKLDRFNQLVRDGTRKFFRENKQITLVYRDFSSKLTAAIKLAKLATNPKPNTTKIHSFLDNHPLFKKYLVLPPPGIPIDTSQLTDFISSFLENNDLTPTEPHPNVLFPDLQLPPTTLPNSQPPNMTLFDEIKEGKFHKKTFLTSLRSSPESDPTSKLVPMVKIVKTFWGKIWKKKRVPQRNPHKRLPLRPRQPNPPPSNANHPQHRRHNRPHPKLV
jgi:hypothetical protein